MVLDNTKKLSKTFNIVIANDRRLGLPLSLLFDRRFEQSL